MAKESVDVLIEGGKATAAPPLGPALGPLGVNIGQVVVDINKKTESFKGMQVPVKVTVDSDTKAYEISIGTPPASALIKKEAGVQKGASNPKTEKVADLSIEQIIKIAKMKEDNLLGKDLKQKVKEIIGTCQAMGIKVEQMDPHDAIDAVNAGKFDEEIKSEKTELSDEERKELEEERKRMQEELKAKRAEYLTKANSILKSLEGKPANEKRKKLEEADIPGPIINELVPAEKEVKK
ncbi:50S ribosomal protein L11 [Candidatus Woesearchaeota archaeon]|nr:50S ribosomal protein L11 [Candidatus Woesearchaeota archaeon]